MTLPSNKRKTRLRSHRETIHLLNQRYKREWDRAEALRAELDHIKKSRAHRFFCWWQRFRALFRRSVKSAAPFSETRFLHHVSMPDKETVSVVIPFRDQPALLRNCLRS